MTVIESKDECPIAVEARDLRKRYGEICAVAGLSFAVRRGEIFALLGVNGEGKSTAVRLPLPQYLRPDPARRRRRAADGLNHCGKGKRICMTVIESKEECPIAVEARDLRKRYGEICAVDGLSFAVRRGEIFALLGVNGEGKSTAVRLPLPHYLRPDAARSPSKRATCASATAKSAPWTG